MFFSSILILLFGTLLASAISIAVLDFEPRGITEDEAVLITDILRTELLKTGRITIIEREKINTLLKERQLSQIGVTESVELGKLLGVEKIIFGRIGKLGDSYVVTVRLIDVESGKVDFAEQYNCQITTESITSVMKEIAQVVQKYLPPIEGKVALRKNDIVYITLSSKEGFKEGMELTVHRVEQVKDEEGNVIFEGVKEIGKIKVLKVSEKGSSAEVISESEKIEKGDVVKLPLSIIRPRTQESMEITSESSTSNRMSSLFEDHGQLGAREYRFWNVTYPDRYKPRIIKSSSFYILQGSDHGADVLIPESIYNVDFSDYDEATVEYTIAQIDGEYSNGGFGFAILLPHGIFTLEDNRDNDGTDHYEIMAVYKEDGKAGEKIMTRKTILWPLRTVWLARLNFEGQHYSI